MDEKRLKDLSALQAQLQAMDDLQQAKDDAKKLKDKCTNPKGLSKIKKPHLKADALKTTYNSEIDSLRNDLSDLEKAHSSSSDSAALYGIFFLLAIVAAVVTLIVLIRNVEFKFLLHLGSSAVVFVAVMLIAILIDSISSSKKKKKNQAEIEICKQRIKEKQAKLKIELANVEDEDNASLREYELQHQQIIDNAKAEFIPLINAKEQEISELTAKYKEVAVISSFTYSDREELKKIIWALEEQYAESISEARRWLRAEDERRKREEEERRRLKLEEERRRNEERQRQAEERKRNSPGTVVVYTMEDDKGKNAQVYVDGNYYGAISFSSGRTSFQLPAGHHNVSVIIQSQGYLFHSGVESFYLEGGKTINIKFSICGYNNIRCSTW